jgi:hypothetical protein
MEAQKVVWECLNLGTKWKSRENIRISTQHGGNHVTDLQLSKPPSE